MAKNLLVSPILKWVGGKRQLLHEIVPYINKNCSVYVEPFVGGANVIDKVKCEKRIGCDKQIITARYGKCKQNAC